MSKDKFKNIFKIVVIGANKSGKTTLIEQFSDISLHENAAPKVGVNFYTKNVTIDNHDYKLQFWDIIDDEKFGSLQTLYYTGASAIFFVFDLSKPETFEYYQTHFKEVWHQAKLDKCPILLIGTNLDSVENQEAIERKKYRQFVKKESLLGYIELNSTTNIDKLLKTFPILIQNALKKTYQVKFLVNSKELNGIKNYSKLSHQTQSEFIRTAIWEKIRSMEASPIIRNSIKNKDMKKAELRLDELRKIRESLERLEKQKE
ncbi:MAG: GTP-binding protein [Candidatus Odinarchaeota archaeon]